MIRSLMYFTAAVLVTEFAAAAVLEGRISITSNSGGGALRVIVDCSPDPDELFPREQKIGGDGYYRVSNLPDNAECSLTIKLGGARSEPYAFRSSSGKITVNRRIKRYGNDLVVL